MGKLTVACTSHIFCFILFSFKQLTLCSGTYPWDVGNDFKGDSAARDGAALRHSLQQALSKTLQHKHTTTFSKINKSLY